MDINAFKSDIEQSELIQKPCSDLNGLVHQYNKVLLELIEKHAPLKIRQVTDRPKVPWINQDFKVAKIKRRKIEKEWRKNKTSENRKKYNSAKIEVLRIKEKAKEMYYTDRIEKCDKNQKLLFELLNEMLCKKTKQELPDSNSDENLANSFNKFFMEKIESIRNDLKSKQTNNNSFTEKITTSKMENFQSVSQDRIKCVVNNLSSATCPLDPIKTDLVKKCLDILVPTITTIVNSSLKSGVFPSDLKSAIIRPALKKPNLDRNNFKNYRPVSNIPFLSKVIEKCAISQLDSYMNAENMHELHQSAYRVGHSTETALTRIQHDIACELDQSRGVILILLDLSAAFDTIDHQILHDRMKNRLGIHGTTLDWFDSYHHQRTQRVLINDTTSQSVILQFGGPQGSLIGAEDYKVYTLPVGDIIRKHGLMFEIYADDTQLYISFVIRDRDDLANATSKIELCVLEIKDWMTQNLLKLNAEKTEVIYITPPHFQHKFEALPIHIDGETVFPSASARNIGVIFDKYLSLHEHISSVCRTCVYHLRNISAIRKYIPQSACESLIHALVSSRLDYANSLFSGMPKYQIARLQRVQNMAARIVLRIRKFDHITPALRELHWLPVEKRIVFKILLLTFKCLNGAAPLYLKELLKPNPTTRNLRSNQDCMTLYVPKSRTARYGQRAFGNIAPKLWNELPSHIRAQTSLTAFKRMLKTRLFLQAYQ